MRQPLHDHAADDATLKNVLATAVFMWLLIAAAALA